MENKIILIFIVVGAACLTGCASPQKAYNSGYDRGRSDTVKQQYWITQARQESFPAQPKPKVRRIPITTTYQNPDGTVTVPTTEYIRIEE